MFTFSLERGYSGTTMFAVAAVAILLSGLFYYRAFGMLRRGQWQILLALRIVAIILIVLLLFRPVFSYHKKLTELPAVVFLLDTSASMSISDAKGGNTRFEQAREQLQRWWEKLADEFDLHLIEFSEHVRVLEDVKQLATLAPKGKATSLSRALDSAAKELPERGDVEAVIMLSDGIHNSARNPLDTTANLGIIVHTVGVGSSLRSDISYTDIQVTGIDCPDRLMLNNKARITASVEAIGLGGRPARVILEDDGQEIDGIEVTLDNVDGSQEVEFEFRPTTKGRHTYTVRVGVFNEEKIKENNQRSAVALVIEPGIRVLYVEGTLRAEYGALVDRFLAKDPDLEFCALVQTRPNVFLRRSNMEGLDLNSIPQDEETVNKFDVFIIGDLDSSYIRAAQQELIVKRIRDGAGLVMLGGYHSMGPGGYADVPLGEILPVSLGSRDVGQFTDSFLPVLTPDGAHSPIFANIAGFFPTRQAPPKIAGLPPLDGCTRVEEPRPGATVLATSSAEATAMPVMVIQPVGKGRTAVFSGDTTRKWQQGPRALDQESPFLRFWGQVVRWAAGRSEQVEAKASITAGTDKAHYDPDEPILISAIVRDSKGEGADGAKVEAKIGMPVGQGEKTTLSSATGPGHYNGKFEPEAAGTYKIKVEGKVGELTLETDEIIVEVGRPNLEFEKLDLDDKMLGRIASDTGGRYVHVSTADHLIDQFDRSQRQKQVYFERPLYWPLPFWVLFVAVLTVEWVLRRRFQLR